MSYRLSNTLQRTDCTIVQPSGEDGLEVHRLKQDSCDAYGEVLEDRGKLTAKPS